MERPIVINNFNLCPLTQLPTLGTECLQCEHMNNNEAEYFCIYDEDSQAGLPIKEIIDILLDLLVAGKSTISQDELMRIITDI